MRIQIIPETEAEKQKIETLEHTGIREFMLFGKKVDSDGQAVDVHEWTGSYRYLIGSMAFFQEVLNDERRERNSDAREQETRKNLIGEQNTPQTAQHPAPELKVIKVDGSGADTPTIEEDLTPSK